MTQGSLLAEPVSIGVLIAALQGKGWRHRDDLALKLGWSVRTVKLMAQSSQGAILSGPGGLRLTIEATEDELLACLGRFTSQIHEMSLRVVETRHVWELKDGAR